MNKPPIRIREGLKRFGKPNRLEIVKSIQLAESEARRTVWNTVGDLCHFLAEHIKHNLGPDTLVFEVGQDVHSNLPHLCIEVPACRFSTHIRIEETKLKGEDPYANNPEAKRIAGRVEELAQRAQAAITNPAPPHPNPALQQASTTQTPANASPAKTLQPKPGERLPLRGTLPGLKSGLKSGLNTKKP